MPLDQESINTQLALLRTHRRTLAHLLEQAAQFGGEVFAPPQTANGIVAARAEIRRIKAALRAGGVSVEDEPNDEAPPQVEPVQSQRMGGDVVSGDKVAGDKVAGDKVMGDKRTITTEGGNYAEGNIDKRQGAFVSGGTIQGPAIGINQGTINANYTYQQAVSLAPALHQLRAPVNDFVGREQEIDQLVQALSKAATSGVAVAISGVRGMGGIGKTELAYVVADRLKAVYPDGQIVVELRGASSSPLTREQALQVAIHAFEREVKLPDDLSHLQALYRDRLTGKRALIVADDAKDAAQVRPLLPPAGCALLVTSRNRFSLPGMQTVNLEVLSPTDAKKLLLEVCPRIGEHAGELARLCGYLPLALRVSAGLLRENDSRDVGRYLVQLRVERLKYLADPDNADDPQASVEASLRLSYDALGLEAQSALCQLSAFKFGFDEEMAKAVIVIDADIVEIIEYLQRRSLIEWSDISADEMEAQMEAQLVYDPVNLQVRSLFGQEAQSWIIGPYKLHDLVRFFASKQLNDLNSVNERIVQHFKTLPKSTSMKYIYARHILLWGDLEAIGINLAAAIARGADDVEDELTGE
jgi:NB-ARC domain